MELHGHEYTQINYIIRGYCKHALGSMVHDMRDGDVFVIPPYTPHRIIAVNNVPLEVVEIEFNSELVTQEISLAATDKLLLDFLFLNPYLTSSESNVEPQLNLRKAMGSHLEALMLDIVKEFGDKRYGYELIVKSLITALVVLLGREYQSTTRSESSNAVLQSHHQSVNMAIQHIEHCYNQKLWVEDVAKIAMLSTSYFCYVFKSITHKTFIEYVNNLRVEKSKELLCTTSKSVAEVCFDVGFNNISHFNRLFKQCTGMSPSAFRKKLR